MKVKVLSQFKDKYTRQIHKAGDELDITEERYKEILTVDNLVEPIQASEAQPKKTRKASSKKQ